MSKKIPVSNSPWGRDYERPSDCQRWIERGEADVIDGTLVYTEAFFAACQQTAREFDPAGFDDGTIRRWVNRSAYRENVKATDIPGTVAVNGNLVDGHEITRSWSGYPSKQLRPISQVGTGSGVTKKPDRLTGRRERRFRTIEPGNAGRN